MKGFDKMHEAAKWSVLGIAIMGYTARDAAHKLKALAAAIDRLGIDVEEKQP